MKNGINTKTTCMCTWRPFPGLKCISKYLTVREPVEAQISGLDEHMQVDDIFNLTLHHVGVEGVNYRHMIVWPVETHLFYLVHGCCRLRTGELENLKRKELLAKGVRLNAIGILTKKKKTKKNYRSEVVHPWIHPELTTCTQEIDRFQRTYWIGDRLAILRTMSAVHKVDWCDAHHFSELKQKNSSRY